LVERIYPVLHNEQVVGRVSSHCRQLTMMLLQVVQLVWVESTNAVGLEQRQRVALIMLDELVRTKEGGQLRHSILLMQLEQVPGHGRQPAVG